ncbi:MAG: hypothetical protein AB7P33_09360 [Dehalococcoidia bacterium]
MALFGILMAVTGGFIATGVTTLVSAHGGDASKIHACVNNSSGTIKIVGVSDGCKNNETALDWNIQGVAGPAGAAGPAGPAGPAGAGKGTVIVGNVASNGSAQGAGYTSSFNVVTGCYELQFPAGTFPGATPVWTNVTPFAVSGVPVAVLFVGDEEDISGPGSNNAEVCFVGGQQASFNFITGENSD